MKLRAHAWLSAGLLIACAVLIAMTQDADWTYEEDLRMGAADGNGPDVFGRVLGVEADAAGRTYVLDGHNHRIVVFDRTGRVTRTIGRRGRGPGELEQPIGLAWLVPGLLVIADAQNARYVVFDTAGRHIRDYRRVSTTASYPWVGAAANNVICDYRRTTIAGVAYDEYSAVRGDSVLSTLRLRAPTQARLEVSPGNTVTPPFAPRGVKGIDCARQAVWVGNTGESTLYLVSLRGDTLRSVAHGLPRVPVTAAERTAAVSSLARASGASEAALARAVPPNKPFFGWFFVDAEGRPWLQPTRRQSSVPEPLRVLQAGNRWTTARMPSPYPFVDPVMRDSLAYIVQTGSFDVPYVLRLKRVARPGTGL